MIRFLKKLAIDAGRICQKEQDTLSSADVDFKSKKDLVTSTDKKVEQFIIQQIKEKFPAHAVLGEETGSNGMDSDYLWIIDPIDGTTSFFHRQPFYSVSIAVRHHHHFIGSAVFLPALDELFWATPEGAFLNKNPICVSETSTLIDAVMATGFACLRADLKENNLPYFNKIVPQLRDVRRYGSAAIDLCYVACGRLDGFWELNLNLYDIAAGVMILENAGGKICDFNGEQDYPAQGLIATNNTGLQKKLLENFKNI